MKKIISLCLVCIMCLGFIIIPAHAENDITVSLNGNNIEFDAKPILISNTTMVPIRAIAEALGATVSWDENTYTATIIKGDTTLVVSVGGKFIMKNGQKIDISVPITIINDRIVVPIRAIAECFECIVNWDNENQQVIITTSVDTEKLLGTIDAINAATKQDIDALKQKVGITAATAIATIKINIEKAISDYIHGKISDEEKAAEELKGHLEAAVKELNAAIATIENAELKAKLQAIANAINDIINDFQTKTVSELIAKINAILQQIKAIEK